MWGRFTFLLPFAGAFVLWHGVPEIKPGFYLACASFAVCQTISTMALSKALKLAEISMVTALWKVSLLILVVLGYFTLRERPTLLGIAGILISMSGVYLLNVNRAHIAWWAPLAVLFTDRGMRYTLLAALFFAPSVVTIKWAMQCSDQYMGTLGGYVAASLLVTPIVLGTSRRHFVEVPRYWKAFVSFGLFASLTTISQGTAYLMTLSSYVEAVKQVEILFAMAIGTVMFHEKQKVRDIAPGALVMLAGVVLAEPRRLDLGPLAVGGADDRLDAAAHREVPHDLDPARRRRGHEIVQDPVGHVLVEGPFVPVRPDVELDRLELEQVPVRHVADSNRGEVGLAGAGAHARELGDLEADLVVAVRVRIGHDLERLRRLRRHGPTLPREGAAVKRAPHPALSPEGRGREVSGGR